MLTLACLLGAVFALRFAIRVRADGAGGWRRVVAMVAPPALLALGAAFGPRGYLLTKSVGGLMMPLGLVWLALLVSAVVVGWRGQPRLAALFASLWFALTLVGNEPLARWMNSDLEGAYAWARPLEAGPFDAVIVLGGGTSETRRGEAQLASSGDRIILAARLYHRGRTPLLVSSGSPIAGISHHDSGLAAAQIWGELGIPEEAIRVVPEARTTSEEARLHSALAREAGWTRVGLVSSARHLPRALAHFRAEGLDPTPLPADVRGRPRVWRGLYDLIPNAGAAAEIHGAAWEWVGRAAGR